MEIKVNPDQIKNPLLSVFKECNESVIFGLHSIEQIEKYSSEEDLQKEANNFQQNGIPFRIGEFEKDLLVLKKNYKNWLLKKGFEDLIKGVNLSLIEVYFYEEQIKLDGIKFKNLKELENKIDQLRKEALNLNNLPKYIEQLGFENWTYKDPVLKMNRTRACLVHRNGIVTKEKDLTNKENSTLEFQYYSLQTVCIDKNGKETDIKEKSGIGIMNKLKTKEFKVGEKIAISYSEFNECMYTCFLFITEVTEKLKSKYGIK